MSNARYISGADVGYRGRPCIRLWSVRTASTTARRPRTSSVRRGFRISAAADGGDPSGLEQCYELVLPQPRLGSGDNVSGIAVMTAVDPSLPTHHASVHHGAAGASRGCPGRGAGGRRAPWRSGFQPLRFW